MVPWTTPCLRTDVAVRVHRAEVAQNGVAILVQVLLEGCAQDRVAQDTVAGVDRSPAGVEAAVQLDVVLADLRAQDLRARAVEAQHAGFAAQRQARSRLARGGHEATARRDAP